MKEMQFVKLRGGRHTDEKLMNRSHQITTELYEISYSFADVFSHAKTLAYQVLCCKCYARSQSYLSGSEYFFQKGYDILERDLDNINLLKTIKKMKAAISLLAKDREMQTSVIRQEFID